MQQICLHTPKGNFRQLIPKQNLLKREIAPFRNETMPGFHAEQDEDLSNDIAARGFSENAPSALAVTTPGAFFDKSQLKLPSSINIKNFPFLNTDFNIDLTGIDVSKLNENLQQAFKEIENINWNEVQNNINENLSKVKVTNLPTKEQVELLLEKSKELYKLEGDKLKIATKSLKERINKENQLWDSLSQGRMVMVYNNNARIQREYKRAQSGYAEAWNNNSYDVNYSTNRPSEGNAEDNTVARINGNNNVSTVTCSNIALSPKHIRTVRPNKLHQKKFIQFSFDSDTNKSGQKKVINVEITDLP